MIAAIGAVALVADIDGTVEIGDGETARNAGGGVADFGGELHQVEQEGIKTVLQLHGDLHLVAEVSIDPEAVVKSFFLYLEMNVGSSGLHGIRHDGGDELCHRLSVVGRHIEVVDSIIDVFHVDSLKIGSTGAVIGRHRFDRTADFRSERDDLDDLVVGKAGR